MHDLPTTTVCLTPDGSSSAWATRVASERSARIALSAPAGSQSAPRASLHHIEGRMVKMHKQGVLQLTSIAINPSTDLAHASVYQSSYLWLTYGPLRACSASCTSCCSTAARHCGTRLSASADQSAAYVDRAAARVGAEAESWCVTKTAHELSRMSALQEVRGRSPAVSSGSGRFHVPCPPPTAEGSSPPNGQGRSIRGPQRTA
jgi:hypothetical protein